MIYWLCQRNNSHMIKPSETTQRHQWTISGQLVDNQWTTLCQRNNSHMIKPSETTQRHQWTISGQPVDNQRTTQWTTQWTTAFYRVLWVSREHEWKTSIYKKNILFVDRTQTCKNPHKMSCPLGCPLGCPLVVH